MNKEAIELLEEAITHSAMIQSNPRKPDLVIRRAEILAGSCGKHGILHKVLTLLKQQQLEGAKGELIAMQMNLGLGHRGEIILTTQERVDNNLEPLAKDIFSEATAEDFCCRWNRFEQQPPEVSYTMCSRCNEKPAAICLSCLSKQQPKPLDCAINCGAMGKGDDSCCGCIYWSDDGKLLCNECGTEYFLVKQQPPKGEYKKRTVENTYVCPCGNVFVEADDYDTLGSENGVCCPDCGNENFQTVKELLKQPPASEFTKECREIVAESEIYNAFSKRLLEACDIIDTSESSKADLLIACKDVQDWLDTSSLQKVLVHYCKEAPEQNALIMGIASHLTRLEAAIAKATPKEKKRGGCHPER